MQQELPEIPHNALVLVGDGRKVLILRNLGAQRRLKFETVRLFQHETPPNRELISDRPGRTVVSTNQAHNAYAEADWHHLEEARFVRAVEDALTRAIRAEPAVQIVIVLPPKSLGEFRAGMSPHLKPHVIGEVAKDLTKHTVADMERVLKHPEAVG